MKLGQAARCVRQRESLARGIMPRSSGLPTAAQPQAPEASDRKIVFSVGRYIKVSNKHSLILKSLLVNAYTVVEQESMTKSTVNSLGKLTVNAALENIDCWLETDSDPRLFQGPFGVLGFLQQKSRNHNTVFDASQSQAAEQKSSSDREIVQSFATDTNTTVDEPLLPATSTHHRLFEPTPPSTLASIHDNRFQDTPTTHSPSIPLCVLSDMRDFELSTDVPPQALELLRLFKAKILSLSFPLRGSPDCPWQTIHLPAAMSTYAELMVTQETSHHRLSLFHSLVSASCLYDANRSRDPSDCEKLRVSNQNLAEQHLTLALEEEFTSRKPVKYKEFLMAILSMIYLEVCKLHLIPLNYAHLTSLSDFF